MLSINGHRVRRFLLHTYDHTMSSAEVRSESSVPYAMQSMSVLCLRKDCACPVILQTWQGQAKAGTICPMNMAAT